jgi:hypothetical protein
MFDPITEKGEKTGFHAQKIPLKEPARPLILIP